MLEASPAQATLRLSCVAVYVGHVASEVAPTLFDGDATDGAWEQPGRFAIDCLGERERRYTEHGNVSRVPSGGVERRARVEWSEQMKNEQEDCVVEQGAVRAVRAHCSLAPTCAPCSALCCTL